MAHTEFGPKLLQKILAMLGENVEQQKEARFEGRRLVTIIKLNKAGQQNKGVKEHETKNEESSSQKIQNNQEGQNSAASANGVSSESLKK